MALKVEDIGTKRLPKLPDALPVVALKAPTLDERRPGLRRIGDHLKLGDLQPFDIDHGVVMASKRGEIEFFDASGSVWVRDATAVKEAPNELRRWPELQQSPNGGPRVSLAPEAAKRLIGEAKELMGSADLIGQGIASEGVALDQVAQLDAKGKELKHGAGAATVKFTYEVEGLPVRGAGAKTLVFAEPGEGEAARITGAFHAWRTLGESKPVKLPPVDEALAVGLLTDPELVLYHGAGHKIKVTRLELVYLALPAFTRQSHLFPAFQVEGEVGKGKKGPGFRFARFHHVAPRKAYDDAGLFGRYLSVNPDGIAPSSAQRKA